jgi:glutamyl/glutaminyl-tRNA synthetase
MRFRVDMGPIKFVDLVFGEMTFRGGDIGDFSVTRADGSAGYLLSAAVDDMKMGITHVIRGEDHLSNTPRQIMIINALGGQPPHFAHLPVILGEGGKKLSKRTGSRGIIELLDAGFLPDAVNTSMAGLGWSGAPKEGAMSIDELARDFDLTGISRSPARFDSDRLNHINHSALVEAPPKTLFENFRKPLESVGFDLEKFCDEDMLYILDSLRDTMGHPEKTVEQALQFGARLDLADDDKTALKGDGPLSVIRELGLAISGMETLDGAGFTAVVKSVSLKTKQKGKNLYHPIRLALTGRRSGPKLEDLLITMGPGEATLRIENTLRELGHTP